MNIRCIVPRPLTFAVVLLTSLAVGFTVLGPLPQSLAQEAPAAEPGAVPPPPAPDDAGGPPKPDPATTDAPEPGSPEAIRDGEDRAAAALLAKSGPGETEADTEQSKATEARPAEEKIDYFELLKSGGPLMYPIGLMSFVVVLFGLERLMGLRRRKVLPSDLIDGIVGLTEERGGFDPRKAYKLCQQFPSAAASVIKAMLLKVGRPQTEVEHALSEASNREAARLYSNVRWLSLAAGITPLLGLLGTVLGMIKAFFHTANLPTGANKGQELAGGIYEALVTTCAGLTVAIPAAILAHLFEGRIQKLFRHLDETLLGLMPQLERFEGRLRVNKDPVEEPPATHAKPPPVPPPANEPPAHQDKTSKQKKQQRAPK